MAHKNSTDIKRKTKTNGDIKNDGDAASADNLSSNNNNNDDNKSGDDAEEITGRFVGVDETDTAAVKMHVLKTRSSSEQNLMLQTSSLRKGVKYLSNLSLPYNNNNNNSDNDLNNVQNSNIITTKDYKINKQNDIEINVTVSIDTANLTNSEKQNLEATINVEDNNTIVDEDEITKKENKDDSDLSELIKAVSNASIYKKNANVYSVFQAKTLISERRRSIPMIPKLLGQKIQDASFGGTKLLSKTMDDSILSNYSAKELKDKTIKTLSRGFGKLLRRHSSVNISEPDPVFKVAYLGNVLTGWAKGDGCVDRPLATLWKNYNQLSKPDVVMKLSITNSGLKGVTKNHGLTEYWAQRITYCCSPPELPKVFCWVYRHEGRKLKHELRCHAVLCSKDSIAKRIASELQMKIKQALLEFKRDKICKQNARLSLANAVYDNPSLPRRKILLSVGGTNYKPPLERSKSAPKLMSIEEMCSEEDEEEEDEPPKKSEMSTNTWTKEMSTQKMCCKSGDYFPSYTLGRRKCDKKCVKKLAFKPDTKPLCNDAICLTGIQKHTENKECNKSAEINNVNRDCDIVESKDTCDERISSQKTSNHVSFNFSTFSDTSDSERIKRKYSDPSTDTDDEVFYCETDEHSKTKNGDSQNTDRGSQSNYMVLDSDEGSISSGCETASTVTSSDIEMTSLPCNFTQSDYNEKSEEVEERISVLERVQSFEQLFNRGKNHSVRNFKSFNRSSFAKNNKFDSMNVGNSDMNNIETNSTNTDDSLPYSLSVESGPTSLSEEVNSIPLGETDRCPRAFMKCSAYPSDDETNASSLDSREFENQDARDACENLGKDEFERANNDEGEKVEGDSDSACSVESGYSEYLEAIQSDCIIGQTVMV